MRALKYIENLFDTLKKCDQNGGPTGMAFGLAGSLIRNNGFDIDDIAKSYMGGTGATALMLGQQLVEYFN